jgi:hypothetical protein
MSVKFYQRSITVNGKTFPSKFFVGDPSDFVVEPTKIANSTDSGSNATTWGSQGVYGTNASFFDLAGFMTALHVYNNSNMVDKNGNNLEGYNNRETAGDDDSALDFLYYTGSSVGLKTKTPSWTPTSNLGITNMVWGIGGFNLLLSNTSINSESTFTTALKNYYPSIKVNHDGTTSRTSIGYRGATDSKIVLAACFGPNFSYINGPTFYDLRAIMNGLGCTIALSLDGSSCTKVSYKQGGVNQGIDNSSRQTWCRMRLKVSAADSTDWTGV